MLKTLKHNKIVSKILTYIYLNFWNSNMISIQLYKQSVSSLSKSTNNVAFKYCVRKRRVFDTKLRTTAPVRPQIQTYTLNYIIYIHGIL